MVHDAKKSGYGPECGENLSSFSAVGDIGCDIVVFDIVMHYIQTQGGVWLRDEEVILYNLDETLVELLFPLLIICFIQKYKCKQAGFENERI